MENFSLLQILEAFCAPINEEQAWAVCYQCAKFLQIHLIPTLNDDSANIRSTKLEKQSYRNQKLDDHVFTLKDVALNSDGNVSVDVNKKRISSQEKMIVQALGIVIFQALDYGLNDTEEQKLSPALENIIGRMTGEDAPQDGDEGIVDDEKIDMCLEDVVQECIKHIGTNIDVGAHCKAVCRALVHESGELIMFLERVVSDNEKKNLCGQLDAVEQDQLFLLQRKDWAHLWMQVMKELRQGVKLKKVQQSIATHPLEYELTPYEILMDDVRGKRYTLNKVEKMEDSYPMKVKKDVHEIILEFIRSRPPLQPMSKRVLSARTERSIDPREQLLNDIRTIKPQLKPTPRAFENAHSTSMDSCGGGGVSQAKKVIKPDLSLLSFGSFDNEFDATFSGHHNFLDDDKNKVTVQDLIPLTPLSPKSPPKHLPWQHTDDWCSPMRRSEKNKTITTDTTPSNPPAFFPSCSSSSLASSHLDSTHQATSGNKLPESSAKNRLLEFRDFNMASTVECLSLTIEEVMHIRGVLTKAELECATGNPELHSLLENGKVCFSCKKVKFSIFGPWPTKCKFCCRNVCSRCSSKMRIPTEHFEHIPVYTLNPCPSSPLNTTAVHHLDNSLSGSAPSSPERELPKFSQSCNETSRQDENKDKSPKTKKPSLLKSVHLNEAGVSVTRNLFQRSQTARPQSAAVTASGPSRSRMLEGGPLMNVCSDCRSMVVGIIRASRRCLVLLGQKGAHGRAERAYSACPSSRRSFTNAVSFESTPGSNGSDVYQ